MQSDDMLAPRGLPWLPALCLALCALTPAEAARPEACPDGIFELNGSAFVDGAGVTVAPRIVVSGGTVALAGLCDAVEARVKAKRKATRVSARWTACPAFPKPVVLKAGIDAATCETMTGVLRAKKVTPKKQPFTAVRASPVVLFVEALADPDVQARLVDGNFPHTIRALIPEQFPETAELIAAGPAALDDVLPAFSGSATLVDEVRVDVLAWVLEQIGDARAVPVLTDWLERNLFATTLWSTDLVTHAIKVLAGDEGLNEYDFAYSVQEKLDTIARVRRPVASEAMVVRPAATASSDRCPQQVTVVGLDAAGATVSKTFDFVGQARDLDQLIAETEGSVRAAHERMRATFLGADTDTYEGTSYATLPGEAVSIRSNCGGSVTERILNRIAATRGLPLRLGRGNATASGIRDLARLFGDEVAGANADAFTVVSHEDGPDASGTPAASAHVEVPLAVGGASFSIYSKDNQGAARSHPMDAAAFGAPFVVGSDGEPSSDAVAAMDGSFGAPRARYKTKLVKFYRFDPARILDLRIDSSPCPCEYRNDVALAFTIPSEDEVSVRVAGIGGTIGASGALGGVLRVNDQPQAMSVDGGAFSTEAILRSGDNRLRAAVDFADGRRGCADRTLRSTVAEATVSATLTWSDAEADMDLYVTQPDGETAWYSRTTTTIGGSLDRDDTSGHGPETYSLSAAEGDSVVPGDYVVRVHYYSDRAGTEPPRAIPWRVEAVVNEGTPSETRVIRNGVLSVESSTNDAPGSSGPDWADVATLTVPAPSGG